jgi:hypothetical protein
VVSSAIAMMLGSVLAASSALGAEIPGATYTGTHPGGGTIEFTVSADGTRVDSYRIRDVPGDTCIFNAGGDKGEWEGAAIVDRAFEYRLYDSSLIFRGLFSGAQSASGTFRMSNAAVPGVKPACDTGTVAWTATTTSMPAGDPSQQSASPAAPASPTGTARRSFGTSVALRRLARTKLTGRIRSHPGCISQRWVTLKRGSTTVRSTLSRADGTFRFTRSAAIRGRQVRATVSARTGATAICAAGTSKRVKA